MEGIGGGLSFVNRTLDTLRKESSYRRRLSINSIAFLGGFSTVTQIVLWITNAELTGVLTIGMVVLLVAGLLLVTSRSLPPMHLTMSHASYKASLEIIRGDLFAFGDGPVVISTNRNFDVGLDWVAEDSLVRQLIRRRHDSDPTAMQSLLVEHGLVGQESEVGRAIGVPDCAGGAVLLAVARRDATYRSAVLVEDITLAASSLWTHARANSFSTLTMPVIGSGFARAQIGTIPLLMLLVTSFITSSMEVPICHVRIVLPPHVNQNSAMEVTREYLRALGFEDG